MSLELGGKSPNIVFSDADPQVAIAGAANAIFFNHGQCCVAGSRLYVEADSFEEVVAGVADIAKAIKLGDGLDPDTQMGPLVSDEQLNKVSGFLDSGREQGATIVAGGRREGERGYFFQPTVVANTRPDMRVVKEESSARSWSRPRSRAWTRSQRRPMTARSASVQGSGPGTCQSPRLGQEDPSWDCLDQLLQRLRRRPAVRWLQAVRMGSRDGPPGSRGLHRGKGRLHAAVELKRGARGKARAPR